MKRKFLLAILIALVALSTSFVYANEQNALISVFIDGKAVNCAEYGQEPTIINGRTLVPLRSIFEALGATVEWDKNTRTVSSKLDETEIELTIGENFMIKNGEKNDLDVPAQIMNGRTLVPARAVSEAFGLIVNWHSNLKAVSIIRNTNINYVTMYDKKYKEHSVEEYFVEKYKNIGWYDNPEEKILMYNAGGRIAKVSISNIEKYKANEWSVEPFVWMYADGGLKLEVHPEKVEEFRMVGWSTLDECLSRYMNVGNVEAAVALLCDISSDSVSEDAVRSKLNEIYAQTGVPFFATNWKISETILGTPEAIVTLKNMTDKEIISHELTFVCYDAYGQETADSYHSATKTAYSDRDKIKPYGSFTVSLKLYNNGRTQKISVPKITKVAFSDGTYWEK